MPLPCALPRLTGQLKARCHSLQALSIPHYVRVNIQDVVHLLPPGRCKAPSACHLHRLASMLSEMTRSSGMTLALSI